MIDVRSRCADGFEESGDEFKVVINKVKSRRCLNPARVNIGKH